VGQITTTYFQFFFYRLTFEVPLQASGQGKDLSVLEQNFWWTPEQNFFTGQMNILSPNQQYQSTKW